MLCFMLYRNAVVVVFMRMTPAHFTAVALVLCGTLLAPSSALPDRYADRARAPVPGRAPGVAAGDTDRQKRAYTTWKNYEVFSRWKAPMYQLSRPYFIPTYGAPDRVPIFFPPQRLNLNPGTPLDNPLPNRPFKGPVYLPPTSEKPTTMKIDNRFSFDDEDDKDRPVWAGSPGGKEDETVPTRPPRPPGASEVPGLVHDITGGGSNKLAADSEEPRPSIRVTTVAAPTGPSNCVWAIVSCCSASTTRVPDSCFEQRGCPGPFWGSSPCDSDYAKAAIAAALNYYEK